MNLIPEKYPFTGNYFCTWSYQMYAADIVNGNIPVYGRDALTEKKLFDDPGILTKCFKGCRSDLIVVLDDGWDVGWNLDTHKDSSLISEFASCELFPERFPSFTGDPAERLRKFNEKLKSIGYKGLGLWIACQVCHQDLSKPIDMEYAEKYWTERAKWCDYAGVLYWKVDWGYEAHNLEFRKMLTRVAKKYAPNLTVEHAGCIAPFNNLKGEEKRFSAWNDGKVLKANLDMLAISDILRAYDACGTACILDRTADLLKYARRSENGELSLINVEHWVYMAAGLGCSTGVMNSHLQPVVLLDCVERTAKWQRIAPPFSPWDNKVTVSDEILHDSRYYGEEIAWAGVRNEVMEQWAPASVSRGMPLPEVMCDGEKPFVVTSCHPVSNAVAVASLPRCFAEGGDKTIRADVVIDGCGSDCFGVFGCYKSLKINNTAPYSRVMMQDIMGSEAVDVTSQTRSSDGLLIDGALIEKLGLASASEGDASEPGAIIKLI